MSLYNFVYKLQRKQAWYKRRVLVGLLVVSFLILVAFWVIMFRSQISKTNNLYSAGGGEAETLGSEKMMGPVAALIDGFKNLKSDIAGKLSEFRQKTSEGDTRTRPVYELPMN